MGFGKQKPQLAGPDYLLGVAHEAAERGQPFAAEFRDMVMAALYLDSGVHHLSGSVM